MESFTASVISMAKLLRRCAMNNITFSNKKPPQRIRDIGVRSEKMDSDAVARALNAEVVSSTEIHGSPITMYALRKAIGERLTSTGGRPALAGSTRRQKIPISDQDWDELKHIAEEELGSRSVSPAQVGALLIRFGIAQIRKSGAKSLGNMS
jgi:lipoate-protein ligase A